GASGAARALSRPCADRAVAGDPARSCAGAGLVRAPGFTDRRSPGREASARPRAARTVDAGLPAEGRGSDAAAPGTGSATGRDERVAAPFARAAGAETVAAGAETVAAGAETVAAGP